MEGGPSHIDLFDPKPELERLAGQPMPASFGKVITAMGTASNTADALRAHLEAVRRRAACGSRTGIRTSRSTSTTSRSSARCWADGLNHVGSVCQMNTGFDPGRAAVHGRVGHLRPGHGQQQSAHVRDPHRPGRGVGRPEELELRISARDVSGHAVPPGRDAPILDLAPPPRDRQRTAARPPRPAQRAQPRTTARASRRIPRWKRASTPTNWPTACSRPRPKRSI